MSNNTTGILTNTKNNIIRNRWLSLATILVTTIVFATASFFIILSLVVGQTVKVYEKKAQLEIYFTLETPEVEIQKFLAKVEAYEGIDSVDYISKQEALTLYVSYYSDDPDLLDSVSADWLPASVEAKANSLEELDGLTDLIKAEQSVNPYIDDVRYHEDVVKQLKSISHSVSIGAIGIIVVFSIITVSLIFITIAFNIRSHKNEIEIMQLVGSSDRYIKLPFVLEGVFYTVTGAFLAATIILVPWLLYMKFGVGTNFHFVITDILKELSFEFARGFNIVFVTGFYTIHILIGALVGFAASSVAVMKNLDLKEK